MVGLLERPDPCMDKAGLDSLEAAMIVCYPSPGDCGLARRISLLREAGINGLCIGGPVRLAGGIGVLGKGHAGVVAAGYSSHGRVAVKILRVDSKRDSLEVEGRLAYEAWRHGAAPRVHYWSREVIVEDYIPGPSLGELLSSGLLTVDLALEALRAARALDAAGILHREIHRPWRSVLFTPTGKALIVDYESASRGCGNAGRLLTGILSPEILQGARHLLRAYKERCSLRDYRNLESLLQKSYEEWGAEAFAARRGLS